MYRTNFLQPKMESPVREQGYRFTCTYTCTILYPADVGMIEVSQRECEVDADADESVTLLVGDRQALSGLSHRLDAVEDEGHTLAGEVSQLVVAPDNEGGIAAVVLAKCPQKLRSGVVQPGKECRREIADVEAGGALHLDVLHSQANDLAVVL